MFQLFRIVIVFLFLALPLSSCDARAVEKRFTILGLGDSITEGGETFHSYLYPLWERLFTAGYNADFIGPRQSETRIGMIHHYGNSGKPVEFLEERIDSVYRRYPADIVLLHAGHNHFVEQKPVDGIIRAYDSIIRKIHAVNPQAHIFLAQVTPSGKLPKYAYIPELNRRIAAYVSSAKNKRLHLVDMATGHDYRTMTIHDLVHPSDLGADRMADRWLEAISRVFKPHRMAFRPERITYRQLPDGTALNLHLFRAAGKGAKPAIVYFFAGGWKYGSPLQFYRECEWHRRQDYTAISADYRISSLYGTTASEATADGIAAIDYLRAHADELGIDPSRIIVAGASAGATIAGKIADEADERRGFVGLVNPTTDKLDVVSKFRVAKGSGPYWSHMHINDGILYLRHGEYFAAYKIK